MNRLTLFLILLLTPLVLVCDIAPTAPSKRARTTVAAFTPVVAEYEGEGRSLDSAKEVTWSHPEGIGGRHVVTILTERDSIRVGVDVRSPDEHNQITIYSRR